eukprot:7102744-Lingulodinium_polyedra.AAC.1
MPPTRTNAPAGGVYPWSPRRTSAWRSGGRYSETYRARAPEVDPTNASTAQPGATSRYSISR